MLTTISLRRFCCFLALLPASASISAQEKPDLSKFAAQLKNIEPSVRRAALEEISQIEDPAAIELMIGALGDSDQNVRATAILALGQAASPRAVEPLIKLLKSPHNRD